MPRRDTSVKSAVLGGIAAVALWYLREYQNEVKAGNLLAGKDAAKNIIDDVLQRRPELGILLKRR